MSPSTDRVDRALSRCVLGMKWLTADGLEVSAVAARCDDSDSATTASGAQPGAPGGAGLDVFRVAATVSGANNDDRSAGAGAVSALASDVHPVGRSASASGSGTDSDDPRPGGSDPVQVAVPNDLLPTLERLRDMLVEQGEADEAGRLAARIAFVKSLV